MAATAYSRDDSSAVLAAAHLLPNTCLRHLPTVCLLFCIMRPGNSMSMHTLLKFCWVLDGQMNACHFCHFIICLVFFIYLPKFLSVNL
jgi:hypothetical protein